MFNFDLDMLDVTVTVTDFFFLFFFVTDCNRVVFGFVTDLNLDLDNKHV